MSQALLFPPAVATAAFVGGDPDGLRYYQRATVDAVHQELLVKGVRSTVFVLATGLGKTQIFSAIAKHWDGDVLVLAHREELVRQAQERLKQMTGLEVGVEMAGEKSSAHDRIVVGSVDSVKTKSRLNRLGRERFRLVVVDEAHHYVGNTYVRPLEWFDQAKIVGATATPDRGDRRALGQVFDSVAYEMDMLEGIEHGWITPFTAFDVDLAGLDLSGIEKSAFLGGMSGELDARIAKSVEGVVAGTLRHAADRHCILFFPGVNSAKLAAARFNELQPNSAAVVHGGTPDEERAQIMEDYRRGKILRLTNCMVATEGFDAPITDCVGLCRPTLSRALIAQMAGRGGRPLPRTVDRFPDEDDAEQRQMAIAFSKKPECVLLNFVGAGAKHDLCGPEDVLGGRYTSDEVTRAKKTRRGGENVKDALDRSRAELKAAAAMLSHKGETKVTSYNPFEVLHVRQTDEDTGYGYKPPSPAQVSTLRMMGVSGDDLESISRQGAIKLITSERTREHKGLARYAELAVLRKYGISTLNITQARAQAALDYIQDHYLDKSRFDPKELNRIVRDRQPGED